MSEEQDLLQVFLQVFEHSGLTSAMVGGTGFVLVVFMKKLVENIIYKTAIDENGSKENHANHFTRDHDNLIKLTTTVEHINAHLKELTTDVKELNLEINSISINRKDLEEIVSNIDSITSQIEELKLRVSLLETTSDVDIMPTGSAKCNLPCKA